MAALFAVHPLHVESVAWIAERKDVLSGFFWMLTLLAYAWYAERPAGGRYSPVLAAFALGLMAKPMLVTLPCVLLLLDYWPLGRLKSEIPMTQTARVWDFFRIPGLGFRILEKLPLFALAAASGVVTALVQSSSVSSLGQLPAGVRWRTHWWPMSLTSGRRRGRCTWGPCTRTRSTASRPGSGPRRRRLLTAVTLLTLLARRRHPYLLVGWLWYLGTLVPVIGLVQVGRQALADRYTYLPSVGLGLMAAWGVAELSSQWRAVPVAALLGAGALVITGALRLGPDPDLARRRGSVG